jgi:16S rRNA (cytidine1402-2'-O)-methyltransferase
LSDASSNLGSLFLVATPIGNLQDITLRALKVLREVALIAAEDTRHTRKLLSAHGLKVEMISYRDQNHKTASGRIRKVLDAGRDVALVTDAGMPGLSDPGQALVRDAIEWGVRVIPVPGPTAVIAALAASGLQTDRFVFLGFLPRKTSAIIRLAEDLAHEPGSLVIYESPVRLGKTLGALAAVWGARRAVVVRELSKLHETFDRGTLAELSERYKGGAKGEVTLVVEGSREKKVRASPELQQVIEALQQGRKYGTGEIARLLGGLTGLGKRVVYQLIVGERDADDEKSK